MPVDEMVAVDVGAVPRLGVEHVEGDVAPAEDGPAEAVERRVVLRVAARGGLGLLTGRELFWGGEGNFESLFLDIF